MPMIKVACTKPTMTYGTILPNMISTGLIGIDSRLSMVPRSISRVTESAVKISMVMVRMVPTSPGTMLSRDEAAGL